MLPELTEYQKSCCKFHNDFIGQNILSQQLVDKGMGSGTFTRRQRLWSHFLTENKNKREGGETDSLIKAAYLVLGGSGSGKTSYVRKELRDACLEPNVIVDDHPTRTLLKDIIPRLQEEGIPTNIIYVAVPMIDAFKRSTMREEQGVKESYHPKPFLRSHDTQQDAFRIGYETSLGDPSLFSCKVVFNPLSEEERELKQYVSKYMVDIPAKDAYAAVTTQGRRAFSTDQQYQELLNAIPEAQVDEPTQSQPVPSAQAEIVQPAAQSSWSPQTPGPISGPWGVAEGIAPYYSFNDAQGNVVSVSAHNLLPAFHGQKNTEVTAQPIAGPYSNDFGTPCYSHAGAEVSADNTKLSAELEKAALQQKAASAQQYTQDPQVRDDQPEALQPYGRRSSQAYDTFATDLRQALPPVSSSQSLYSDPYGRGRMDYPQTEYQPEAVQRAQPAASPATAAADLPEAQGGASPELRRTSRLKSSAKPKPKALEAIKNLFKRDKKDRDGRRGGGGSSRT